MKKHAFSTGFVSTILICVMLLPLGWAQQPKPGGTLRVAWEADIEAVEALDAHTVKFTLKHPTRTLLAALAADRVGFLLMSPAAYKTWGHDDVRLHPVGTGPFKLGKWE
jgi:ABC-type transport system substrate-binding protein